MTLPPPQQPHSHGAVLLADVQEREIVPGYRARFVHGTNMTLAFWEIDAGAVLPEHSHPHEQASNLLRGEFELTLSGECIQLKPGMVVMIPPDAVHGGRAITACQILDVFQPVREDYR